LLAAPGACTHWKAPPCTARAKSRRWQKKDQNADVSRLDLPLSLRALNLQCLKLLHDNKGQIAQLF
jgi:hypothetical protein